MPVYKDEKRGTFFCSFYYTDWTGEKKKKTKRGFKLKRDAQNWERSFLEQRQGEPTMTFASLAELYMGDLQARAKPSTIESRTHTIRAKYLPFFGKLPINLITPAHVRQWQNMLIEQGYKDSYLRSCHTHLSTIFNFGVRYYNLRENPCIKAGVIGGKAAEMLFWTRQEYSLFIERIQDDPQAHLIFQIFYWTGVRLGELLALTPEDFDFENKTLSITKSYQRIRGQDVVTDPKTQKSTRTINLMSFLCEEAKAYINRMYDKKARLFSYSQKQISTRLDNACRASGVKRIRIHDIRHSHASLLIELGVSPLLIAERLGHEKIDTTLNIYSHLYPNKQAEIAEKLEILEEKHHNSVI